MVKVNIGTALNVAYTRAVREGAPAATDPRTYLARAREAIAETVAHHVALLADPGAV
jgi:fructose-bisphosphate aldolase class II